MVCMFCKDNFHVECSATSVGFLSSQMLLQSLLSNGLKGLKSTINSTEL